MRVISRELPLIVLVRVVMLPVTMLPVTLICHGRQIHSELPAKAETQAPHRTVTGNVSNAISGEPIRHALVQFSGTLLPVSVLTGADGRFQIDDVPEGQLSLSAQKPGFFDPRFMRGNEWGRSDPWLTVGSGKNDFTLTLVPTARIAGRVTDRDGEPVENAQVQVLSQQIVQGRKQWQAQNGASTDDDGFYRIDDLVPGRYVVFTNGHALPSPSFNAPREVSAPKYYPDARDLASAQPMELRAGQEFRADFRLSAERGFRVAGTVGGISGPLNVGLSLENSSGQAFSSDAMNFDQSRGQFVLQSVPSGTWTLVISGNDAQGHSYETREEVAVNGTDVTGLQILLHPAASIPVTVNHPANATQSPMDQAPANPGLNATLTSAELLINRQYGVQTEGVPPILVFSNVFAGKYKFDVQTYGGECLESAWYGNVDLLRDYLVVGPDAQTQPLTINLRSDCATLSVKIRRGEEQAGEHQAGEHQAGEHQAGEHQAFGSLLVLSNSSLAEPHILPIGVSSAALSGMANLQSLTLAPGSYQVFAFSSLEGVEYANPEALRDYPSQSIVLEAGQKAELMVELIDRKTN